MHNGIKYIKKTLLSLSLASLEVIQKEGNVKLC